VRLADVPTVAEAGASGQVAETLARPSGRAERHHRSIRQANIRLE
jgi:hypothetical protein